jgi:hypothetical protein
MESLGVPIIWSGDILATWEYTGKFRQENSGCERYFLKVLGLVEGSISLAAGDAVRGPKFKFRVLRPKFRIVSLINGFQTPEFLKSVSRRSR